MADKMASAVTIVLDKERHLRLTLSGMIAFKGVTGKDLADPAVIEKMNQGMELEDLQALLWACLRHEDKTITLDQAGDLIDTQNIKYVAEKIKESVTVAMPDGGDENAPLAGKPLSG